MRKLAFQVVVALLLWLIGVSWAQSVAGFSRRYTVGRAWNVLTLDAQNLSAAFRQGCIQQRGHLPPKFNTRQRSYQGLLASCGLAAAGRRAWSYALDDRYDVMPLDEAKAAYEADPLAPVFRVEDVPSWLAEADPRFPRAFVDALGHVAVEHGGPD